MVGFMYFVIAILVQETLSDAPECPDACLCYQTTAGPTVRCNDRELLKIPRVPQSTVVLDLRFNNITEIRKGDLESLEDLNSLLLSYNQIYSIDEGVFQEVGALKYLYLFSNKLSSIPDGVFKGLSKLEQLYLHNNEITTISFGSFIGLSSLERLFLHHNKLKKIPIGAFDSFTALKRLRLESNPLVCDCHTLQLTQMLLKTHNTKTAATCYEPERLRNREVASLTMEDLNCAAPVFVVRPRDIEISSDVKTAYFPCQATGNPEPEIIWRRNNTNLTLDSRHAIMPDGTLQIDSPESGDEGMYECMAKNVVGEAHIQAELRYYLEEVLPSFRRLPKNIEVIEGNAVNLPCAAKGYPSPIIYWFKNGVRVRRSQRFQISPSGDLHIEPVSHTDGGLYRCRATNALGAMSVTAWMRVKSLPSFTRHPSDTEILDGRTASLDCRAKAYPNPSIIWSKDGGRLPSQDRHIVLPSGTLRILFVQDSDQGRYECQAINVIGVKVAKAYLKVKSRVPPSISHPPRDVTVNSGETIQINCSASGDPQPVISWIRGSLHISGSSRYLVGSTGDLVIRNVGKSDEGRYECAARNSIGFVSAAMKLTVKEDGEAAGDKFVDSSISKAKEEVNRAIESTIKKLLDTNKRRTPNDLLRLFQFPSPAAIEIARAAQIFETTLVKIHEKLQFLDKVNISEYMYRYFDLVSQPQLNMIANISGCSTHRRMVNCSEMCFHLRYRTMDGTCNNFHNPLWGASLTPFNRILNPIYENGFNTPVGWKTDELPSPRLISQEIIAARNVTEDETFTHMLMQWGQFLDHDMDFTVTSLSSSSFSDGVDCSKTCVNKPPCFPIQIPKNDTRIRKKKCMEFTRSSAVCGSGTTSLFFPLVTPRQQMNQITSYIDASNVYGSSLRDGNNLRDLNTDLGLLRTGITVERQKSLLPFNKDTPIDCFTGKEESSTPCFLAGDYRANEQLGLLSLHTTWMREHNRIATELGYLNPHWKGEKRYQEARKIVGAEMQHITFHYFLPKILGPKGMEIMGKYDGYQVNTEASVVNVFATAAYRFGHTLINPIISRLNESFQPIKEGNLPLHKAFFAPYRIVEEGGIDPILRGLFGVAGKSTKRKDQPLNTELTERLFQMAHEVALDLSALNIQRGRDHGLAGYNSWRIYCNMTSAETFEDLEHDIPNVLLRKKLEQLYGSPSKVDVWLGGILEASLPGGVLGPLFTCLLATQFQRVRGGDRFWYENQGVFTPGQVVELRQVSLARVICDNADNIARIQPDVFLRTAHLGEYLDCDEIPRMDLRLWKECCDDNNCPSGDRTFTLSHDVRKRRSTSDNEALELAVQNMYSEKSNINIYDDVSRETVVDDVTKNADQYQEEESPLGEIKETLKSLVKEIQNLKERVIKLEEKRQD